MHLAVCNHTHFTDYTEVNITTKCCATSEWEFSLADLKCLKSLSKCALSNSSICIIKSCKCADLHVSFG